MNAQLSICIPHYNRRQCLQELLDSIINQDGYLAPIEICISDDASTDDSLSFLQNYQKQYSYIKYYRFSKNVGLDTNMLKAVSLATGDYCWLMGNDDKVEKTAVKTITSLLRRYEGIPVLNVNGWQYDNQLKKRVYHRVKKGLKKSILKGNTFFNDLEQILIYFGDSFGFLGDNIFKRSLWDSVVSNTNLSKYIGSHYIHLAVLLLILIKDQRLLYVHEQCMGFRGGHDGFLELLGHVQRLKFDVEGYDTVAEGVFSKESRLYKIWMTRVIKLHIFGRLRSLKVSQCEYSIKDLFTFLHNHFSSVPAFWFYLFPLLITPQQLCVHSKRLYRLKFKHSRLSTGFEV